MNTSVVDYNYDCGQTNTSCTLVAQISAYKHCLQTSGAPENINKINIKKGEKRDMDKTVFNYLLDLHLH